MKQKRYLLTIQNASRKYSYIDKIMTESHFNNYHNKVMASGGKITEIVEEEI